MSSVQISESQIGNLVLGSVNQSELTATVTEIVKQGGTEAELGKALQGMIEVVGKWMPITMLSRLNFSIY